MTYWYLAFNPDLCTYRWVRSRNCGCLVTWFCYQLIAKPGNKTAAGSWLDPDTWGKESMTPTCLRLTPVQLCLIEIFSWDWSLGGQHTLICTTNNYVPFPYLDEDGGTSGETLALPWFGLRYAFYRWTTQRVCSTLIVVDQYLRLVGIKWFHTHRSLIWNHFIPYLS